MSYIDAVKSLFSPFYSASDLEVAPKVTFQDFIVSAQQARDEDVLVVEEGLIFPLRKKVNQENRKQLIAKTWRVFKKALRHEFSKEKLHGLAARYMINLNGPPLPINSMIVEFFGVGKACVFLGDLELEMAKRSEMRGKNLEDLRPEELDSLFARITHNSYLGRNPDPREVSGGPQNDLEYLVDNFFLKDQKRSWLFGGIEDLASPDSRIPNGDVYASRIAMGFVSLLETDQRFPDKEIVIPAPGVKKGQTDFYKVYEIISLGGLNAVALAPISKHSKLRPILAFRCTKQILAQADGIYSMLNNATRHIGKRGWEMCKERLIHLIQDEKFLRGKQAQVLYYSLGGAHATRFFRELLKTDLWRNVYELLGFNYVGCEKEVVDEIAKRINAMPAYEVPPAIRGHQNIPPKALQKEKIADPVNHAGEKHVGAGVKHPNAIVEVYRHEIDDLPLSTLADFQGAIPDSKWVYIHGLRSVDAVNRYKLTVYRGNKECEPILGAHKRKPELEDARLQWVTMGNMIDVIYQIVDFVLRIFGIEYFKRNMKGS